MAHAGVDALGFQLLQQYKAQLLQSLHALLRRPCDLDALLLSEKQVHFWCGGGYLKAPAWERWVGDGYERQQ